MTTSKPIRIVVADTGPIIAGWFGEFLNQFPLVLNAVHVPILELQEWEFSIEAIRSKRPGLPLLDVHDLIAKWTQTEFLRAHVLTHEQETIAARFSQHIHPDRPGEKAVDGQAVSLAQVLTKSGAADALLADEGVMRAVARAEGIPVIGSLWIVRELCVQGYLTTAEALAIPARLIAHGQFVSPRVTETFKAQIASIKSQH